MNNIKQKYISLVIIIMAILFIIIGIRNGEFIEIYHKARFICLECIGIG